jgi:hypothetical protein
LIITVDTNILLSIFKKDSLFGQASYLLNKYNTNEYVINDAIYLELGNHFQNFEHLDEVLDILEVRLVDNDQTEYQGILRAWSNYLKKKNFICPSCKKTIKLICPNCQTPQSYRQRILTDFFIGGFSMKNSNAILTLDPTYYKNYFPELKILS